MEADMAKIIAKRRKGSYCARIEGRDPQYHLAREFQDAKATKGLLTFSDLAPGWYEVCEGYVKVGEKWTKPRAYYRVNGDVTKIADSLIGFIGDAAEGPTPGNPGEWYGDLCECGGPVEGFSSVGFPKCAEHMPVAADSDLPVPV